jgi:hypothetical protein
MTNEPDLTVVAASVSAQVRAYLSTVAEVASGAVPGAAIPLLILATSDLLAAGARLGAMVDVVPPERFEPDAGPSTDLDPVREGLARQLEGLDEYVEVVDPLFGVEVCAVTVSGEIAAMLAPLADGLQHYDGGHPIEALWWWQFSYMAIWGERGASVLRVLQLMLAHSRLDVEDDVAAEAEYDALHR